VKTQYLRKVYPEEYVNTIQLVTKQHLHSTTTYHLSLTESRLPKNMTKDLLSKFFLNKRTQIYAWGLQGTYPQKRFLVFPMIKIQDPPTFCSKEQEAQELHSMSALFFEKAHITQEISSRKDHFKTSLRKNSDQACFTKQGQRNKEAFEFNHEMLGGLSMWDP
jgi:hypothetical protein